MSQTSAWSYDWTRRIGRNVRRLRTARKMSAAALSEQCASIGYAIPRSTIANLENGQRASIPVQEIATMARVLDVPPVELLYDVLDEPVEALPGQVRTQFEATEWFGGWLTFGESTGDVVDSDGKEVPRFVHGTALTEFRVHQRIADSLLTSLDSARTARQALRELEAGLTPALSTMPNSYFADWDEARWQRLAENAEEQVRTFTDSLRGVRSGMAEAGMTLPWVHPVVSQQLGGAGVDDAS